MLGEFGVRNTGYVAWLQQLAGELNVAEHVTFVGGRMGQELADLYAAADVLVNCSLYHRENFGMAQAEAQACGLPVVCSAWGGFKDVVRAGETGYLMDAVMTKRGMRVDWLTGATRVAALLAQPEELARMRRQATAWAQQRFSDAALVAAVRPILAASHTDPAAHTAGQPAYAPSAFARRYEAHKRRCGWYATDEQRQRRWYPAMFSGTDYRLYERLFASYATYQATTYSADAIEGPWIPYNPSGIDVDALRQVIVTQDPIWPQHQDLDPLRWALVQAADGAATMDDLISRLAAQGYSADAVRTGLWQLWVDGVLLLARD